MFLNLVMLAGLGAVVVPLVLHLLSRARCQDVHWGAMMFLEPGRRSGISAWRLRQWALLAVRSALIAVLAMALARPVVGAGWRWLSGQGGTLAVIILDCSYSMAVDEAGQSRFDKARQVALDVLSSLRAGDQAGLVFLAEEVEVRPPSGNIQAVAREVAERRVSMGMADVAEGLERARLMLEASPQSSRELYLVCDQQAAGWRSVDASGETAQWLKRSVSRFHVVSVGGEAHQGLALEWLGLVDPVAVRGQSTEVEIRVRNHGPQPRANLAVTLSATEPEETPSPPRELRTIHVTVGAGATAVLRTAVVFERSGSHVLTARLGATGPEPDVRFDTAVDVIEPVTVLIISGDEGGEPIGRESFFLNLALAPRQVVEGRGGDPAVVSVRRHPDWDATALGGQQVVVLANVPQLSLEQVRALEQRVYEGGGLIIAPGNRVRVDHYNSMLYAEGQGLMPAMLSAATPPDGSRATGLLGLELTHPVFRFRRGTDPLPSAVIGRYFPAVPRRSDARVLATYASGEPFLIDGPRGRGRVLLVTTPLDADWNTLPLYPFYLPFVQSMVRYACAPSLASRDLQLGQPLVAALDQPADSAAVLLEDGSVQALRITPRTTRLRFAQTQRSGQYRLIVRGPGWSQVLHYVVQPPRGESDPAPLSPERWEQYGRGLGFTRLDPSGGTLSARLASARAGRELWLPLMLAVVALGTGELWLAGRWSRQAS